MEREDIENSLKVLPHIVDDDFIITVDEARKIIGIDGETIEVLQAKVERLQEQLPKRGKWIPIQIGKWRGHGRLVSEKSVRWAIDDIVIKIAERIGHVPMTKNETMKYVNQLPTIVPAEAERSE